jgi:uncharacterized repeat protein (TIGR03803 family)
VKVPTSRVCAITFISLLSFFGFAAQAEAQADLFHQPTRSPKLQGKTGKTNRANNADAGSGYRLSTLYSFCSAPNCTDGEQPYAGVIMDSAGNVYGTTVGGGSASYGTVFKLDPSGNETVLHSFTGANGDGENPEAGLVLDSAGNLYGTTEYGGVHSSSCYYGCGIVFKLDPSGSETVLYSFTSTNGDGSIPYSLQTSIILDTTDNLYGTTARGGAAGNGTVFKLDPSGNETVLYSFTGANGDGALPVAGPIMDSVGNLYGTTVIGGAAGNGTVFKLDPSGNETVLYSFTGANGDGGNPIAGVVMDSAGNLYGTTVGGGKLGFGAVFKLDASGKETVLYSFTGANGDGLYLVAGVILDSAGNLYGTTPYSNNPTSTNAPCGVYPIYLLEIFGCGTVFKLDPSGNETVLYGFTGESGDGAMPLAGLIMDSVGNLYGTTQYGGVADEGTVFKLVPLPTPTVTVTPSASSVTTAQALSVTIASSGGSGNPTPTGTVTLSSGSYTSAATTLTSGSVKINIPAGSLAVGTDILTASYSGDSNYSPANGTSSVTVTQVPPSFNVVGTAVSVSPGATTGNTSTITVTPSGGFTGKVTLTATITSSPAGAQDPPTLSFGSTSPVSITNANAGTATLTISTTAATSGALVYPVRPGVRWYATSSVGLVFATLFGIGIPTRRRRWRSRFGVLFLLLVLTGGLFACGSSSGGGGNPGTTPGDYTVTVTGTSDSTTATGTVTLNVR